MLLLLPGTAAAAEVVVGLLLPGTGLEGPGLEGPGLEGPGLGTVVEVVHPGTAAAEVEGDHLETVEVVHLEEDHLGTVAGGLVLGTGLEGPGLGIVGVAVVVETVLAVGVEGGHPGTGPVAPRAVDTAEG